MKKGWKEIKLGEYCDVRDGTHDSPKYVQNGYPLVTSKNLKGSFIDYTNIKYITKDDYIKINERSKVDVGDILFAMIGTIGNATLVEEEPTFAIKNMALFKTNSMLQGRFLRYYFQNNTILDDMRYKAKGTTQPFVSLGYLRNLKIQVPTIIEQKEIVEYLDSSFAKIDKLKENAAKNLEEAKALFQSALKDALEPKEGWEEKTLKEICEKIFAGGDAPKNFTLEKNKTNNIPIFANAVKNDGLYGYTDKAVVTEPCVTIAARGSGTGFTLRRYTPFVPIVRLIVALPQREKISIDFLYYFLVKTNVSSSGSAIPQLTIPMIKAYRCVFPPLSEQQSIVSFLDSLSEKVNTLQQNYSRICDECDALKQAILRQVFE